MLVVAGPPGSGKSTFFPIAAMGVDAFGIDDRCAQIVGSYRAIPPAVRKAVSRECETFVDQHIAGGRSFAVETTMRTLASVRQAEKARSHGFRTVLTFLCTSSPEINIERVIQRAQAGGHAASEVEIRAVTWPPWGISLRQFGYSIVPGSSTPRSRGNVLASSRG